MVNVSIYEGLEPHVGIGCDFIDDRVPLGNIKKMPELISAMPPPLKRYYRQIEHFFADSKSADFYEGQMSAIYQIAEQVGVLQGQSPLMMVSLGIIQGYLIALGAAVAKRVLQQRATKNERPAADGGAEEGLGGQAPQ